MPVESSALCFRGENGRDEFGREQIADKVISLLTSDIDISPMVIDGHWGTGKSEFCHKLINKFRESHPQHRLLYVDAFQADHANNPLMTILAEVMSLLPEGDTKRSFLQKAVPVARYSIKTALKAGVSHLLRANADDIADGLDEHLQEAANTAIDASVLAVLKDHEKAEENLKALQHTLADLASGSPIILFIDELDRCRPDFAVQMLEVIKHTFNVDGVQFVLITNTNQLRAAINHCYGPLVDAQRYLDKFLKFSFRLPEYLPGTGEEQALAAVQHFRNLVRQSPLLQDTNLTDFGDGLYGFTTLLISHNRLSLREVETFVRHLEIFQRLSQGMKSTIIFGHQLLRVFGVFVFCFASDVEESIRSNKADATRIAELLGLDALPDSESDRYRLLHTDVIAVLLAKACAFNQEKYQATSDEAQQYWNQRFHSFFEHRIPVDGEQFRSVKLAINCLSLGGRT